ncbi:hypothetical protein J2787_002717 [Chryseobacterium rhizosphaerae]|uniref:Uncharacterized protein n=1 Tax=Chryseobacterium rhizosphaerae TaxID=395937 RepID=A0AAE3YBB6_9FLAO|nr:hypothetical protein [Chryseobacterium rhizosphaerae]MDR6547231.1 hypothetical protein [Chryseobacterium rhizosphaerae]
MAERQDAFAVNTTTKDNVSYGLGLDNIVHSITNS